VCVASFCLALSCLFMIFCRGKFYVCPIDFLAPFLLTSRGRIWQSGSVCAACVFVFVLFCVRRCSEVGRLPGHFRLVCPFLFFAFCFSLLVTADGEERRRYGHLHAAALLCVSLFGAFIFGHLADLQFCVVFGCILVGFYLHAMAWLRVGSITGYVFLRSEAMCFLLVDKSRNARSGFALLLRPRC